MFYRWPTNPWA